MIDRLRRLFSRSSDDGGVRPTVDATTAVQLVRDGATLLDVRERDEWRAGHAPQAVHVPLADVPSVAPRRRPGGAAGVGGGAARVRARRAARQRRGRGAAPAARRARRRRARGGEALAHRGAPAPLARLRRDEPVRRARRVAGRGRSRATLFLRLHACLVYTSPSPRDAV